MYRPSSFRSLSDSSHAMYVHHQGIHFSSHRITQDWIAEWHLPSSSKDRCGLDGPGQRSWHFLGLWSEYPSLDSREVSSKVISLWWTTTFTVSLTVRRQLTARHDCLDCTRRRIILLFMHVVVMLRYTSHDSVAIDHMNFPLYLRFIRPFCNHLKRSASSTLKVASERAINSLWYLVFSRTSTRRRARWDLLRLLNIFRSSWR
jgi:hypothetical protein